MISDRQKQKGKLIQGYRKRRGYTRGMVVNLTGLSKGRVTDIETGNRKPINLKELIKLHDRAFRLPLAAFRNLFPERVDPYTYADEILGKKRVKKSKVKRNK